MSPKVIISFALLLLLSIIGVSIYNVRALDLSSKKMETHISLIESGISAGDWNKAEDGMKGITKSWEETRKTWSMVTDHLEIDNIDNTLSRMKMFVTAKDSSLALAEAASLKQYIKHIPEKESLNLRNLF